jgi:hypothetical protein
VLGPLAMARAIWTIVLGIGSLVLAPIAVLATGDLSPGAILGGLGLFLIGLGASLRWMLVRRRGLAAVPGTSEHRLWMLALAVLGTAAFVPVVVHGIATNAADRIAAGVFGVVLLGAIAVVIAVKGGWRRETR